MYVNGATRIRGLTNHGGTGTGCGKSNVGGPNLWVLNDGKRLHNYGKSPFLMGKSTISMAIFNSFLYVYQRVHLHWWIIVGMFGLGSMISHGFPRSRVFGVWGGRSEQKTSKNHGTWGKGVMGYTSTWRRVVTARNYWYSSPPIH